MGDLDAHKINPPDVYAGQDTVDCPECGAELEVEAGTAFCETCDVVVDEDAVRDQLEARNEPPEWA